jgi:hypothetical protein
MEMEIHKYSTIALHISCIILKIMEEVLTIYVTQNEHVVEVNPMSQEIRILIFYISINAMLFLPTTKARNVTLSMTAIIYTLIVYNNYSIFITLFKIYIKKFNQLVAN